MSLPYFDLHPVRIVHCCLWWESLLWSSDFWPLPDILVTGDLWLVFCPFLVHWYQVSTVVLDVVVAVVHVHCCTCTCISCALCALSVCTCLVELLYSNCDCLMFTRTFESVTLDLHLQFESRWRCWSWLQSVLCTLCSLGYCSSSFAFELLSGVVEHL